MKIELQEKSDVFMLKTSVYDDYTGECVAIVEITDEIKNTIKQGLQSMKSMNLEGTLRLQVFRYNCNFIDTNAIDNYDEIEQQINEAGVLQVNPDILKAIEKIDDYDKVWRTDGDILSIFKSGGFGYSTYIKHTNVLIETESVHYTSYFGEIDEPLLQAFTIQHDHKFGISTYHVRCAKNITGHWHGEENVTKEDKEMLDSIAKQLGTEFEFDKEEWVEIEEFEPSNDFTNIEL